MGWFERLYDLFMVPADWLGFRGWRRWAAAVPGERLLEIGVGTGLNFPHYAAGSFVYAIDPEPEMLELALRRSRRAKGIHVHLGCGRGEELPFQDHVFDAAVATLVFCTVEDPARALLEVRRVLKPGSSLHLLEHVRTKGPVGACILDALTPAWKGLARGCHLNRDTVGEVRKAGFRITEAKERFLGLLLAIEAKIPTSSL